MLIHLANNAWSFVRILEGAALGEIWDQYVGGVDGRAAAIEAGASGSAAGLAAAVRDSAAALERAWPTDDWSGAGRGWSGALLEVASLPFRRTREVEVHRVDLGLGYRPENWPQYYLRRELRVQEMTAKSRTSMGLTGWPPAVLALDEPTRLAWLLGRHHDPALPRADPFN